LNRELGRCFGDHQYSAEELVAELSAAFLTARVGIDHVSQAASYVASWLAVLQSDNRAIFHAARLATEAATFIYPLPAIEPSREDEVPAA
jgi:antirestriction protein ArdC